MKVLHVVRRYGPVGGMERYVWEVTQALRDQGHEVEVLCETCCAPVPQGIRVHELGAVFARPRWLALLRFSHRVSVWLATHARADRIIHSHERLGCHDVSTFHGPPFATIFQRSWWRWISLRVAMQLFLEIRELMVAETVVPVSAAVAQQLVQHYPWVKDKLARPILPAVSVSAGRPRAAREASEHGAVIGFVGKEWKRKGLCRAVRLVSALRRSRPDVELVVVGPAAGEVRHLFSGWRSGYRLIPWCESVPYAQFDVLLHPAQAEPFGMVITEAMASGVPVVVSKACGAAAVVGGSAGVVLSEDAPESDWIHALEDQLDRHAPVPVYQRSWQQVATECEAVYRAVSGSAKPLKETSPARSVPTGNTPAAVRIHAAP